MLPVVSPMYMCYHVLSIHLLTLLIALSASHLLKSLETKWEMQQPVVHANPFWSLLVDEQILGNSGASIPWIIQQFINIQKWMVTQSPVAPVPERVAWSFGSASLGEVPGTHGSSWKSEGIGVLKETGLGCLKDACVQIFIQILLGKRNRRAWIVSLLWSCDV